MLWLSVGLGYAGWNRRALGDLLDLLPYACISP
jgi:hypothetical protein